MVNDYVRREQVSPWIAIHIQGDQRTIHIFCHGEHIGCCVRNNETDIWEMEVQTIDWEVHRTGEVLSLHTPVLGNTVFKCFGSVDKLKAWLGNHIPAASMDFV